MRFSDQTKVSSVFRQAFMVAGGLVLGGIFLGLYVNELFFFMAGLVGVGLWVSALLGHCPMALVIAKLPWNKK